MVCYFLSVVRAVSAIDSTIDAGSDGGDDSNPSTGDATHEGPDAAAEAGADAGGDTAADAPSEGSYPYPACAPSRVWSLRFDSDPTQLSWQGDGGP